MAGQQARIDRIGRSLKRLGFELAPQRPHAKIGRGFKVTDRAGAFAIGSAPSMTLAEVEHWIGEHIKPGKDETRR